MARTRYGNAAIVRRSEVPVIDQHAWTSDGRLTLSGTYAATAGAARRPAAPEGLHRSARAAAGAGRPALLDHDRRDRDAVVRRAAAAARRQLGDPGPARRDRRGRRRRRRRGRRPRARADHARLRPRPAGRGRRPAADLRPEGLPVHDQRLRRADPDRGPAFKITEGGRVQRKVLRSVYYPVQQRRPLRDAVVFISWKGKQCGDNPQAIAEELRRRGDTREHIWAVTDWSVPVPARRHRGPGRHRELLRGAGPQPVPDRQRRHAGRGTSSGRARCTCRPGTARR